LLLKLSPQLGPGESATSGEWATSCRVESR